MGTKIPKTTKILFLGDLIDCTMVLTISTCEFDEKMAQAEWFLAQVRPQASQSRSVHWSRLE